MAQPADAGVVLRGRMDTTTPDSGADAMSYPQSRLLRLPTEIRLFIYRMLFSNLKVTVGRRYPPPSSSSGNEAQADGAWAMLRTCWTCYNEGLPIFYEQATISLKYGAYLFVLQKKIGRENMARLRCVSVGGYDNVDGPEIARQLPATLDRVYIKWKGGTAFYSTNQMGYLDDDQLRTVLDHRIRLDLKYCVRELWAKNPKLRIYLDVKVDFSYWVEVCASSGISWCLLFKRCLLGKIARLTYLQRWAIPLLLYVDIRVEIVKGLEDNTWSWGTIERKVEKSMVEATTT